MTDTRLLNIVRPWIEEYMGFPYSAMSEDSVPVLASDADTLDLPLRAIKVSGKAALAARPEWVERLKTIVDELPLAISFALF